MAIVAKQGEQSNKNPAPEGTHIAVCTQVIDLGHQYSEFYDKTAHKVMIGWELQSDEKRDDGKPFVVWKRYTLSLGDRANLRRDLKAWRGRDFTPEELDGFDLRNILGKSCMIGVTHRAVDGKTYVDVSTVAALPKNMKAAKAEGTQIYFDINDPDMAAYGTFSDGLKKTIQASEEWKARDADKANDEPPPPSDEDVPF